jgi:hypothetical protein
MIASKNLMRKFVESLKGKNYSEVIVLADREATQAYRNALRSCHRPHLHNINWCQYSKTLTNMISFLRNEVKFKNADSETYTLFRLIQNGIDQESQKMIQAHKVQNGSQGPRSNC